ncbi:hypothetical protein DERP_002949, partial [Dermatophagoides pteronyssinus]
MLNSNELRIDQYEFIDIILFEISFLMFMNSHKKFKDYNGIVKFYQQQQQQQCNVYGLCCYLSLFVNVDVKHEKIYKRNFINF